jgi:hypothetical protein
MVAALPAGILADRHRRDSMLRTSALLGLVAGSFLAYTLLLQPTLRNLCIAMVALGTYRGFYNPPLESIFADSVRAGRRRVFLFGVFWLYVEAASVFLQTLCGREGGECWLWEPLLGVSRGGPATAGLPYALFLTRREGLEGLRVDSLGWECVRLPGVRARLEGRCLIRGPLCTASKGA